MHARLFGTSPSVIRHGESNLHVLVVVSQYRGLVERAAETGLRVTFLDFDVESRKVERGVPTLADVRDIRGVTFPLGVR